MTLLKTLTVFSVFVLCFYADIVDAQSNRSSDNKRITCKRAGIPPPDVTADFIPVPINYDFNKTTTEMMIYQSGSREQWIKDFLKVDPSSIPPNLPIRTNGMTDADFSMDIRMTTTVNTGNRKDSIACAFVRTIDVKIGYANTIIIPKEFERDSCEFTKLLKFHEQFFIEDLEIGKRFTETLRNNLRTIAIMAEKSVPYEGYRDEGRVRTNLKKAVHELLNLYFDDMKKQQREFIRRHSSEQQLKKLARSIDICIADRNKDDSYAAEKGDKRNFANEK